MKLERVYHQYQRWEEIKHNMWGTVADKNEMLEKAIEFTGNHELYGEYMMRVTREWPYSCENALTDCYLSKKAWIGHAACALALNCPEDITRKAWGYLSDEQQLLANKKADEAIQAWEHDYIENKLLCKNMGEQMLFGWDS